MILNGHIPVALAFILQLFHNICNPLNMVYQQSKEAMYIICFMKFCLGSSQSRKCILITVSLLYKIRM